MSGEFELIDEMVAVLGDLAGGDGVVQGPGDDAAVLRLPPDHELVVSTDTLIAGRHYPAGAAAELIGYRSMAVAASDLAAMGAAPAFATVSLNATELTVVWARDFARGVADAARAFGLAVVGGNLARGPQSVTVTVHGQVPAGLAILRSGAEPGQGVYVTGALGGAKLALRDLAALAAARPGELCPGSPAERFWRPRPRLDIGVRLRGVASAAIDVSDGLAADLEHLCQASGVHVDADFAHVPTAAGGSGGFAAAAGDDYELAFTAASEHDAAIRKLSADMGVPISQIGTVVARAPVGVSWFRDGSAARSPPGYRHF